MRSRGSAMAFAVSALLAGGSAACYARSSALKVEGEWHLARGNAEASEYAETLDSAVAERELATFDKRRAVLERAHAWQRAWMLCLMAAVAAAFAGYLLRLLSRLREMEESAAA